ncbi:hypothetical protein GOODEAATRI_002806 [Goodea atripinnis]|uniref:Uncharacterized protein n=1 Tax=Goodea atripinnis TaxID=208336 RepID=A0ABV0PUV6_9TELE
MLDLIFSQMCVVHFTQNCKNVNLTVLYFFVHCQLPSFLQTLVNGIPLWKLAIVINPNVDMPDCKSIVRQENFPFALEQMSQLLAPLPGSSGCCGSAMPCRNTTMPTQSERNGAP